MFLHENQTQPSSPDHEFMIKLSNLINMKPAALTRARVCSLSIALCSRTIPTYSLPATHTESSEGGRWVLLCSHTCRPGGDDQNNGYILQNVSVCTCALLGLDQSRGSIHAHDQTAGDLRVERSAVTRLLHPQDPPDPRHHLVRRRVRRFVQVDEARPARKQEVPPSTCC